MAEPDKRLPRDLNDLLKNMPQGKVSPPTSPPTTLAPEDEAYLITLITAIRAGKRAIIIAEDDNGDKLKYMFSNASRAEAVSMLGKVIEATGRKLANGD